MMIIGFIGIGVLIYYLLTNKENGKILFSGNISPEDLLKQRYIKGEIDEKTFLQMKETIK